MTISLVSGAMVSRQLGSGDFSSGSATLGTLASGAVTSGNVGVGAVCSGSLDAATFSLMGSSDYDRFRARGTVSGFAFAQSGGDGRRWYPAGFAVGRWGNSLVTFWGERIWCLPICSEMGGTIDDMRVYRNFAASGYSVYLGIYDNVDSTMQDLWPGSLVVQSSGGLLASGSPLAASFNPGIDLKPNWVYWLAYRGPEKSGAFSMAALGNIGAASMLSLWGVNHRFQEASQGYGVSIPWSGTQLPDTFPTASGDIISSGGTWSVSVANYIPAIAIHYA